MTEGLRYRQQESTTCFAATHPRPDCSVGAMFVVVDVEERKHKDLGLINKDIRSNSPRHRRGDVKADYG